MPVGFLLRNALIPILGTHNFKYPMFCWVDDSEKLVRVKFGIAAQFLRPACLNINGTAATLWLKGLEWLSIKYVLRIKILGCRVFC